MKHNTDGKRGSGMIVTKTAELIASECAQRMAEEGPVYASPIEGYGDLTAIMEDVKDALKETRKKQESMLPTIREKNPQALMDVARQELLMGKKLVIYSVKLAAACMRMEGTAERLNGGGDLLTFGEDFDKDDESKESEDE